MHASSALKSLKTPTRFPNEPKNRNDRQIDQLINCIKSMIEAWIDYSKALEKAFNEKISNYEFMMERDQKLKALQGKLLGQEQHLVYVVRQLNECYGTLDDELAEQLVCKAAG